MATAVEPERPGRAFLMRRVGNEVWSRLSPGEVLLEVGYGHMGMPGMVAVTNWRLLFIGKGIFTSARAWCSVPRAMIVKAEVRHGLGGIELHVTTNDKRLFEFLNLEQASATRIGEALADRPGSDAPNQEITVEIRSRRFVPVWLLVLVVLAGAALLFVKTWLGIIVLGLSLVTFHADGERLRQARQSIEARP